MAENHLGREYQNHVKECQEYGSDDCYYLSQMWYKVCAVGDGSDTTSQWICNHPGIKLFYGCCSCHCQRDAVGLPQGGYWVWHWQGKAIDLPEKALVL